MNRPKNFLAALLTAAAVATAACDAPGEDSEGVAGSRDLAGLEYAPELDVDIDAMEERSSGLYVQVLEEGRGPPAEPGDSLRLHYTGWLPSGYEFDSSAGGDPIAIRLGATPLIEGWTEGLEGMRPGEHRMLVIPPDLAYGDMGAGGVIPPGAALVFQVELVENAGGEPGGESGGG